MKECDNCEGHGDVEDISQTGGVQLYECRMCGGEGEVHEEGCPRCGEKDFSDSLQPDSSYKQTCKNCGWFDFVG